MSHEASTGGSSRGKELERTEGNGPAMKGHGPGTAGRVAGEVRELGPRTFTHAVPTFWSLIDTLTRVSESATQLEQRSLSPCNSLLLGR